MQKRNQYVDALKGYAIFLVVVGHAIQRTEGFGYWPFPTMSPYLPFSGYVTMPLFFAISGYLIFGRVRRPIGGWLGSKARLLLIPFVSWTLLFYVAVHDRFIPTELSIPGYVRSQIVSPSLWYFVVLFLCYMVLAIGFRFGDWTLPLLGVVLALAPVPWLGSLQWFWWWFIGGYFTARFQERLLPVRRIAWPMAVAVYVAGVSLLGQHTGIGPRVVMGLSSALLGTLVVWLLIRIPIIASALSFMGVHSLEIYAGEFLFVQLLIVRSPLNALVTVALAIAGSTALGYVLHRNRWTDAAFLGAKKLPRPQVTTSPV